MTEVTNPANAPARRVTEATRVSMSLPTLSLQVPEKDGWHRHWFISKNVARALRAGYTFVEENDVDPVNSDVAGDLSTSGSTDMGTRISKLAGGFSEGTHEPERLYLMELPQEWRDKDVKSLEAVNENIASALRSGRAGAGAPGAPSETSQDQARRYMKSGQDLFYPKVRRT